MSFNMLVISEGVYYFIRAILCFGLLDMCFCVKQRRWRAVGISILIAISHSFNIRTAGNQLVNVELATEILIIVLVSVFYIRAKLMKIVSITWLCCVTVQMLEFLLTVTLVTLKKDSPVALYAERRVAFLFFYSVLLIFVFLFLKKWRQKGKGMEIHSGIILAVDVLYSILIVFFQRVYLKQAGNYILRAWLLFGIYTILIAGVCVLSGYWRHEQQKYRELCQKNEMLEQNYRDVMKVYRENARLFHDFRAHMSVISQYLNKGDIQKCLRYVDEMIELGEKPQNNKWTGNEIVDLILNCKKKEADEKNLVVEVFSDNIRESGIPETDLCAIFSNLLDNALENCGGQDNKIEICIKVRNEFLIVIVKNSVKVNCIKRGTKLITAKKDKLKHGIGLESIRYSAERNSGNFEYKIQDNYFEAIVTLPL